MSNFASWRKCDFQIHTPRDPMWKGDRPPGIGEVSKGISNATKSDVSQRRLEWADKFLDACVEKKLRAVAITDHHEMVMIPYVRKAISAKQKDDPDFDLWLFPGMEITCQEGVQCLILFDSNLKKKFGRMFKVL